MANALPSVSWALSWHSFFTIKASNLGKSRIYACKSSIEWLIFSHMMVEIQPADG